MARRVWWCCGAREGKGWGVAVSGLLPSHPTPPDTQRNPTPNPTHPALGHHHIHDLSSGKATR